MGLEAKEGALGRIVRDTAVGAGIGVWRGSSFGWPGALAGGIIGSSAGTLRGVVKEYPPLRGWIDDSKKKVLHELTDGKADRMHQIRWKNYDASYYKQTK
ncbi:MAG: hypothetical protein JEY79_18700 [Pseudodesulfovibrio sp.]|nr:hypothetical protein [Pseudodesulfovibrio sp.]